MITATVKLERDGIGIGRDGGCVQCAHDMWTESAAQPIVELVIAGKKIRLCNLHADRTALALRERR